MIRNRQWQHAVRMLVVATISMSGAILNAADQPTELGPAQDMTFTAQRDGTPQQYVIRLPQNFDASIPHDLMIALHGHGSDRWQFAQGAIDECRAARDLAAAHQMIYVSPDYRAKTSWMGPAAESDLVQIIDDLNQQYRIRNLILCGASMGGTSALAFTAMHPELIDGVVSMNGTANVLEYTGFSEAFISSYGGTKTEKPEEYRKRSAELFPERFTMPIAITTGERDTVVPPDSCKRLADVLKQKGAEIQLIHRPEGGHNTPYADGVAALQYVIDAVGKKESSATSLLPFQSPAATIVCLGDSVTGVYYHTGGWRAYPEMLQIGLRQLFPNSETTVINAGISGNTTQDGLARLDSDVLAKNPQLVTISFGLNDMVRVLPDAFRSNLELLVNRCRAHGSQVVLCTPNAVIDTSGRPIDKLITYCDIIRSVGRDLKAPVCDQYQAGTRLKTRAPWTWRLTLSDEIHPNMDGHKRMAEELIQTIASKRVSLDAVSPPRPTLPRTTARLQQKQPIRVLAMPPYDGLVAHALKQIDETATVEVTTWTTEGKTLATLEQEAKTNVRAQKPDLVILAVPRSARAETNEQFVHSFSWIMNWSLSFGHQEWDCVIVHPLVASAETTGTQDDLIRRLVKAQHLELIDRTTDEKTTTAELFSSWLRQHVRD
ncbi:SGNH/GDSL hydrolase family protein [Schlesneria paludicola]|uniref:SGNH/GDSL hydrolase family protein n=1 Tax=Schlesneria paludicola TaxID=360056 RepID=UPI00029B3131|nr:alpha/beta fold hydrolase [Schlesneria paludicola]